MAAAPAEADWEASKENFQPLKTGRKAAALRDSTAELRSQAIEERRRAFWEELAGYAGDDPLEVWLRFIKWTQETFSAGGHKAELLPLLERCTRELQATAKYASDIRYLRVWIQYADCLPDPGDVFSFLKENDIGQEHALYYLAFATYLETRGSYAHADSVYQQGINRLAAPVERLRAKFQEFQQRMARRIQRKAQEQALEGGGNNGEPDHPERKSLGLLGGRKPPRASGAAALLGGTAGLKRKAGDQENVPLGGNGNGLDIFVDDEFSGSGVAPAASAPAALFQPGRSAAAPWTKLGSFEQNRKENTQRANIWAGQKMKQQAAHSAPAAPALEIFVDPELAEAEQAQPGGSSSDDGSKPTLRQRLDRDGPALPEEQIMQNPIQLHKAHTGAAPAPLGGLPGRPDAQDAKRRREEVMAFNQAALIGSTGEELCFEEVRAARWQQQQQQLLAAQQAAAQVAAAAEDDMELVGDTCMLQAGMGATVESMESAVEAAAGAAPALVQRQSPVPAGHDAPAGSGAFGSPVAVESGQHPSAEDALEHAAAPVPLSAAVAGQQAASEAATAAATGGAVAKGAQVQPLAAEPELPATEHLPLRPIPFELPAEEPGFEPTVTLSTRDAFAAINQMFGGALPSGSAPAELFGSGSGGGGSLPAGLEPTMTIATKDAFAALNKMFKGSLPLEHGSLPPNPYAEPTLSFARLGGGSGGGYEPTMTIATKSAFDAINNMFKGALPGEHGSLPPTAAGPAGYEPTVTISTRVAFDAINQMFGGSSLAAPLPAAAAQQQQGGFRVPAPRPPRTRPAAPPVAPAAAACPAGPAQSPGGFCIREDTQFVSVPIGAGVASPAAAGAAVGGISPGAGGGFCIREDTQFITVPASGADEGCDSEAGASPAAAPTGSHGGGSGFLIREDTQFITVPVEADEEQGTESSPQQVAAVEQPQRGLGQRRGSPVHALASGAAGGGGFSIREDTIFVGAGPSAPAATPDGAGLAAPADIFGGFAIQEDTQFVGLGSLPADASPTSSDGCGTGRSGGAAGSTGGLLPRKRPLSDRNGSDASPVLGGGGSPASMDSPAHSANAAQVNKWGFAPGADDTLALNLDDGDTQQLLDAFPAAASGGPLVAAQMHAAAVAASGGSERSPVLELHLQSLQLSDGKENLPLEAVDIAPADSSDMGTSRRRGLADPGVAAAVLQPLSDAQAAQLGGVAVEADEAAEAHLAAAGGLEAAEGDSFVVYADDEEDGSPPFSASPMCSGGSHASGTAAGAAGQWQHRVEQEDEAGWVTPVQQQPEAVGALAVDPFSPTFHRRMLSSLEPAVSEWPGVHCLTEEEEVQATASFKAASKNSAGLVELQLGGLEFAVSGCVGEGAYARVYQGVDGDCADVALKVESPPCPWEWYICKALAGRVPDAAARGRFIDPTALLLGSQSSVLIAPLGARGSLQDLLNAYLGQWQQPPPECVAMFFAVELLRIMQHLHAAHILHTDIKPDNLLVTQGTPAAAGDENAGPTLGLQLIDFGRSVDLELLPPGALLQGDSGTEAFRCVEMREGHPWVWQVDAYGVAATAHTLLYGQYMEVERVRDNTTGEVCLRLKHPFKRQWAGELWGAFFSRLLNHTDASAPPTVDDLVAGFQAHLGGSREAARRLRQELSTAATLLPQHC